MSISAIFGSIKDGTHVEAAAMDHIEAWQETYLAEVERQNGLDAEYLPTIRSFVTVKEFDKWPEDQLPACLIVSPGLAGDPLVDGEGMYRAPWLLGVGIVVSARDRDETNRLAKFYSSAIRAMILQHPSLGGFAQGVKWVDERYNDLPSEGQRTLSSGQVIFEVEVRDVTTKNGGPVEPLVAPYDTPDDWVEVTTTDVEVEPKED